MGDSTLLNSVIEICRVSNFEEVWVILGAYAARIKKSIPIHNDVKIIHNEQWEDGLSESIKKAILNAMDYDLIGFCTVDQPYLTSEHLNLMLRNFNRENSCVVASTYKGTTGIPVIFGRRFYPYLMELQGDQGAKHVLSLYKNHVKTIPLSKGEIDIDYPEDISKLII